MRIVASGGSGGINGGVNDVFNYIKDNQPVKTRTLLNHFSYWKRTIERLYKYFTETK